MRFFLQYENLPRLTSSDVIVNATVEMHKAAGKASTSPVYVHKVYDTWNSETITWANKPNHDSTIEDYAIVQANGSYIWDITDICRGWYDGENTGMMFKASDAVEIAQVGDYKQFYSSDYGTVLTRPILAITFRNNNGLESYWDYTSASAGRAGTGYVNCYTGNLVWVRNDIGFGGNRMPVSINHIYNANDAQHFVDVAGDFNNSNDTSGNEFGLGYGWRTNYNQLIYRWETSIPHSEHYIWEDADGTDHYFKPSSDGTYKDEDGLELTLTLMPENSQQYKYKITDKNGNVSYFDGCGRLVKLENNQQTKSCIEIEYYDETNRITTITDGANRKYEFVYEVPTNLLTKISYTGSGAEEISYVCFGYTGSKLSEITDKDGKKTAYSYYSDHLLKSAQDTDGYQLTYDYNIFTYGKPARIKSVTAEHNNQDGGSLAFKYDHNLTKITDHDGHVQIMQFNDMGNTICIQDDEGRAQYAQFANNGGENESSKANQLMLSSKLQNTVVNLLNNSGFESGSPWTFPASSANVSIVDTDAHYGSKSMQISTTAVNSGAYEDSYAVEPGQSVTFSAYVKPQTAAAMLTLYDWGQHYHSEVAYADGGWTRLEVSYTNASDDTKYICPHILTPVPGTMLADDVQLECTSTASRYNLINNGDFQYGANGWFGNFPNNPNGWPDDSAVADLPVSTDPNAPKQPPQLSGKAAEIEGDPTSQKRISQTVAVSGNAGDSFVYAAWAKGNSASLWERDYETNDRTFAVEIQFHYTDGENPDKFSAQFNPDTDQWQYAAGAGVAQHNYSSVTVTLCYDYNINTVYFDGIQLFKEEFGTSYTYDADGNVESVVDLQKQTTTYEYDTNSNLTKIIEADGAEMTYTYDQWNNVLTATTREGLVYTFTYDSYGNNLSVSITDGINTVATSATYSADGNRLVSTTDALGKVTTYSYNADTNVLEWVQDPEDTAATRTTYTYDAMYRVASVTTPTTAGNDLWASYTYEDDLLTGLETMSTYYTFEYGNFGLRTDVYAGEQLLAHYSYTDDGNNYLSDLDYGNDDGVEYNYDDKGRLTLETFEDGDTVSYTYNSYGNLAMVTDSATGITTTYYYDLLDRMVKYREVSEDTDHSVTYEYNERNNLSSLTEIINGADHTTQYAYDDDNRIVSVNICDYAEDLDDVEVLISEDYTYDDLGRLEGSTVTNAVGGSEVLEKSYTFRNPTATTTSTQIATNSIQATIGQLTEDELYYDPEPYVYDVTYSYTYDDNGNILSISDGTYTTSYVYDSANQLIRENNQEQGFTQTWEYDNSGNILYRREYAYTTGSVENLEPVDEVEYLYEHEDLRDMLTEYDGVTITHDAVGNPLNDGKWTYTWEHGRELASMSRSSYNTWTFAYDANGMRTRRTDGIMDYRYVYNGSQLTQLTVTETWDGYQSVNTLYFTYSADGTPLTVTSEGETYFYVTNIQGDVIAILDDTGRVVCRYIYDAWGNVTTDAWLSDIVIDHNPLRYRGYVYDEETELYYLQSRYYNPKIGRFLNADALVSTGQGVLGNNMFAYCNNNPIVFGDPCGTCIHYWFLLGLVDCEKCKAASQPDSAFKNGDGTFSLYDNHRHSPKSKFHEQLFVVSASEASFSLSEGDATLGSVDATFITGGWEYEHVDLSLLDLGRVEASVGVDNGTFSVLAMASIWAPSVTVTLGCVKISLSGYVGAVGGVAEFGTNGFKVGAAGGWGASLSVSWD